MACSFHFISMPSKHPSILSDHWLWALTSVCILFGLYFPVLKAGYVWDDIAFFTSASDLRTGDIWQVITESVMAGTAYFRPLVMLTFVAEARVLDADPFFSHLINLVLHIANTCLIGLLFQQLQNSACTPHQPVKHAWLKVLAMLLYAIHPALVEPVAWVSGRFDLMVTFFCLAGLAAAGLRTWQTDLLCALLFLAAAFCKEMAATFPLLLGLWLWATQGRDQTLGGFLRQTLRHRWRVYSLVVAAGLIYLSLRAQYMPHMVSTDGAMASLLGTVPRRVALAGLTLGFYIRTVVFPFKDIGPLHPFDPQTLDIPHVAIGWAWIVACIAFLFYTAGRPSATRLLFSAALLSLLPVLNIVPLAIIGNIGHERFLTLPLAFFALGTAYLIQHATGPRARPLLGGRLPLLVNGAAIAWLVIAGLNVHVTVPLWRNELVFWNWAYRITPDSPYAQFSLAAAAINAQRFDILEEVMLKAEKMGVMPLRLTVPYAQYLAKKGEIQQGVDKIRLALEGELLPHLEVLKAGVALQDATLSKKGFNAWFLVYAYDAMAQMQLSLRDFEGALENEDIAIFYQKDSPRTLLTRSFALYGLGRVDDGEAAFQHAERLYLPRFKPDAQAMRKSFVSQLCSHSSAIDNPTCLQFKEGKLAGLAKSDTVGAQASHPP